MTLAHDTPRPKVDRAQGGALDLLLMLLAWRARPRDTDWMRAMTSSTVAEDERRRAFTVAARRFADGAVALTDGERRALEDRGVASVLDRWTVGDLARVCIAIAASRDAAPSSDVLARWFRFGDVGGKRAIVLALPLAPDPPALRPIALDACYSAELPVFEAIANDSPYPNHHFADASFNQLVIKALFVGIPLDRIIGLSGRISPELVRMAADCAAERRAANRSLSEDHERLLSGWRTR